MLPTATPRPSQTVTPVRPPAESPWQPFGAAGSQKGRTDKGTWCGLLHTPFLSQGPADDKKVTHASHGNAVGVWVSFIAIVAGFRSIPPVCPRRGVGRGRHVQCSAGAERGSARSANHGDPAADQPCCQGHHVVGQTEESPPWRAYRLLIGHRCVGQAGTSRSAGALRWYRG